MREFELEADRFAVSAMSRAGYPPTALLTYLHRSAPDDTERLDQLKQLPAIAEPTPSADFLTLQAEIRRELVTAHAIPSLLRPQR